MWARRSQRGPKGVCKAVGGVAWDIGACVLVSCDHVSYMLLDHWEETVVIEMVVGE